MAKKKRILYPVFFMILVTAVFTFLLAFINDRTYERIEEQQALEFQKSILYTFDMPIESYSEEEIINLFKEEVQEKKFQDKTYYIYYIDGNISGYAFQFIGDGLWGSIRGYLAFDDNFTKLLGVDFTDHSETPGLGGRIDEKEFKEQFRNISIDNTEELIRYGTASGGNVDSISGATSTSTAVKNILNAKIPEVIELIEMEGFNE